MASTFHGLELGKRGLAVAQTSISTTGHNIANANTKGYSRQQVNQTASPSLDVWTSGSVNPGQLGQGALVESITRVRDRFLDAQYRGQSATAGEWSVRQETFGRIEVAINEPSENGLRAAMDQLGTAWQDVSNDPNSASAQAVLKERAQAFVQVAQSMDTSFGNITKDLELQHEEAVEEANGLLQQIEDLNKRILQSGKHSNDLLDKRDVLVEQLSSLIPIEVTEDKNGSYNISLASGKALVTGTGHTELEANDPITGGKIAGINESLKVVDSYKKELAAVVKEFAEANGLNKEGSLFESDAEFTIKSLSVKEPATVTGPDGTETGKKYTGPADEAAMKTAQSGFRELVSRLGAGSQGAMNAMANSEASLLATENRRQSVTGISIDEEMANLIKYQHSYSAAARFVSTTDQMLDTIINRMAR